MKNCFPLMSLITFEHQAEDSSDDGLRVSPISMTRCQHLQAPRSELLSCSNERLAALHADQPDTITIDGEVAKETSALINFTVDDLIALAGDDVHLPLVGPGPRFVERGHIHGEGEGPRRGAFKRPAKATGKVKRCHINLDVYSAEMKTLLPARPASIDEKTYWKIVIQRPGIRNTTKSRMAWTHSLPRVVRASAPQNCETTTIAPVDRNLSHHGSQQKNTSISHRGYHLHHYDN